MPRSRTRITYLFVGILACIVAACIVIGVSAAAAQSNIPAKLTVLSGQRTLGVREQTELRIKLLDQAGNEIAAPYDTSVTLIATRQKDIDTAKRDGKGNASFQRNGTLALPGSVNTVQTLVTIRRGQSAAALQFSSHQAGTVRIYAENEKLVTGATLIAVVIRAGRTATNTRRMIEAAIFQKALFQERRPPTAAPLARPSPSTAAAATDYQLEILKFGDTPDLVGDKKQMHKFTVQLKLAGAPSESCDAATQDVEVSLSADKADGTFSQDSFVIPKGDCAYPREANTFIELLTTRGGDIEVVAKKVSRRAGGISVKPSPAVKFPFETTIRATKLLVTATKQVAMANGIERIDLIIQPVDDGNHMISCDEEGLDVRDITLSVATRALGIKFENEAKPIQMKRGEKFIVTSVTGSYPVAGAKIVAVTENADREKIWGEQKLEFCFPWAQLGGAMFGGLMFPLVLTVLPGKRREERFEGGKLKNISLYALVGVFLGGVAFGVVFFGALGLNEFNFSGIPVKIAQLPVHNWLAAIVIGFLGATMLIKGIPFKGHAQEDGGEPEGGQSGGGESPAQA